MTERAARRPPAVARVLEHVTATSRRHGMFEPGDRVVVAVSGGPDSLCLLHALYRLRRLLHIEPVCFHFDHRLREGSEQDAAYVRAQAKKLGVPYVLRRAESQPAKGESKEAWARRARYSVLFEVMDMVGARVAALAHTADDQAETVLLAALRGGGLEALAGMRPMTPVPPMARPLIETTRQETVAFCRALRLRPRHDPTNEDPALMRVAVRTRVIPQVERLLGRGVRDALVRTSSLIREDADLLEELAERAMTGIVQDGPQGELLLRAGELTSLSFPLAGRVVRRAFRARGLPLEADGVGAVLELAAVPRGRRRDLPGGLLAAREREYVRVSHPSPRPRPPAVPRARRATATGRGGT